MSTTEVIPLLLMHGRDDVAVPCDGIVQETRRSGSVWWQSSSHAPHAEDKERVIESIVSSVQTVRRYCCKAIRDYVDRGGSEGRYLVFVNCPSD